MTFDTELQTSAASRLYDPETGMWYAQPYSSSTNFIKVFDSSGACVQTYSVGCSFCAAIMRMHGRKYIPINQSYSYNSLTNTTYLLLDEHGKLLSTARGGCATSDTRMIKQLHGFGEKYPYILQGWSYANNYTSTNANSVHISLNRSLPLLCTINNLSSEVIKTNSQTMKITYEITQG